MREGSTIGGIVVTGRDSREVRGAAEPVPSLTVGTLLDRYELLWPLAQGGMADVWVARQSGKRGFEKVVAVKTILPRFARDPSFQDMLLEEARIASRIEHTNVARILDLGEEAGVLFLVMEHVDGDSLSQLNRVCRQKGANVPLGIVLRILADACAGLHEAHELIDAQGKPLGIVHRDVSPQNILVTTRGVAKLIDFGIASAKWQVEDVTDSRIVKGKISYMAPEQARGGPVDRRADVWGVGVTMYSLLLGKPPFAVDRSVDTLRLKLSEQLPAPPALPVHPSVAAVARKAVAQAPPHRFATALEMREAIENAMGDAGLTTTCADVAAFVAQELASRTKARRRAIERALAATSPGRPAGMKAKHPADEAGAPRRRPVGMVVAGVAVALIVGVGFAMAGLRLRATESKVHGAEAGGRIAAPVPVLLATGRTAKDVGPASEGVASASAVPKPASAVTPTSTLSPNLSPEGVTSNVRRKAPRPVASASSSRSRAAGNPEVIDDGF